MELNSSASSSSSSFHQDLEHRVLHLSNGAIITLIVMVILTFISLLGLLGLYFLCPRRRSLNLSLGAALSRSAAAANLAHIHIHAPNAAVSASRPKAGLEPHEIECLPLLTVADLASLSKSRTCDGGGGGGGCCAVCLAEFSDHGQPGDERIRFLPRCRHCFHPQCVDVWLQTSASCPLCRCDVHQEKLERKEEDEDEEQVEEREDGTAAASVPADDQRAYSREGRDRESTQ